MTIAQTERRLKKIHITLMRNPQFAMWSGMLMVGTTSVVEDCPTACTNGRDKTFGRAFCDSLDDKQLAFVVLHEVLHIAYRHLFIWKKLWAIDAQCANQACDYVINLELRDLDPKAHVIDIPLKDGKPFICLDERFRGMNSKQVFDILRAEKQGGNSGGKGSGDGSGGGRGGSGGGLDEHDWEGAQELSEGELDELAREVDGAMRAGVSAAKKAGVGGGNSSRELGELLAPQVDWREQLREFVKAVCSNKDTSSWRRVNRRFLSGDTYMPSMIGEKVGHIAIGRDTSGSMGGAELSASVAETKGIAEEVSPDKIDLIDWDGVVQKHEQFEGSAVVDVSTAGLRGGGGTDPRCMAAYLKEKGIKPECVIIMTDGYLDDWGTDDEWQGVPVLWAIVGGNKVVAPIGKTIHVGD